MEPENPTFPTPPPQATPPAVSPVFPKKNNLVVILLSVLLLVTLSATAYLFLQVQSLTKQLAQLQIQPTPTPLSTEIPSPTADLTANWKIYTGDGFTLKYPNDYTTTPISFTTSPQYPSGNSVNFYNATSAVILTDSTNFLNLTIANALGNGPYLKYTQDFLTGKTIQKFSIDGVEGVGVDNIAAGQAGTSLDVVWINKGKIYQATTPINESVNVLKQILSTFRFLK